MTPSTTNGVHSIESRTDRISRTIADVTGVIRPGWLQARDILLIDLLEWGILGTTNVVAVVGPLVGFDTRANNAQAQSDKQFSSSTV
jgi:hypothetical protein